MRHRAGRVREAAPDGVGHEVTTSTDAAYAVVLPPGSSTVSTDLPNSEVAPAAGGHAVDTTGPAGVDLVLLR